VAESFADRLDIRYFWQEDLGFRAGQARNMGVENARAEVCVLLDSGILAHSNLLREHVDTHEAADGPIALLGYVYCFMINPDPEGADEMDRIIDYDDPDGSIEMLREKGKWPDLRDEYYAKYTDDYGVEPAPWAIFFTCNASVSTTQVREVGMFDEAFNGWGGEDIDLAYRLHRAGAYFMLNRDALSLHVPHERESKRAEDRNYGYMADKYATPIAGLLREFTSMQVHPFNINDIIKERGLPACNDYDRQKAAS
jgi:GT2 family glycosyltransferase